MQSNIIWNMHALLRMHVHFQENMHTLTNAWANREKSELLNVCGGSRRKQAI